MPPFAETIVIVFALIALGYAAAAIRLIKESTGDGLADFVFTVAIPLFLFRTIATAEFDHGPPFLLWAVYFATVLVTWTLGHVTTRLIFGRDTRAGVVAGLTASFSNLAVLGIPFFIGIFGEPGFAILSQLLSVHLPIMMGASILLFDWALRRDGISNAPASLRAMAGSFLRQLLSNPLILGILAGVVVRVSGFTVPSIADKVIASLGMVAGPVALFSMGIALRGYGIRGQIPSSLLLVMLKLAVMPAIALAFALMVGLPELPAKVAVAAASLPTGANPWLIATRFGTGQRLASTSMTISTAIAAVSTGIWLFIADMVF